MFWTFLGVGLGAAVGIAGVRWVAKTKQRYSPPNLARQAGSRAEDVGRRLGEAVEEGRRAMAEREAELRARLGLPPA